MGWRLTPCYVWGHKWHQPEGVFTPTLCRRCGVDHWHLTLAAQMSRHIASTPEGSDRD